MPSGMGRKPICCFFVANLGIMLMNVPTNLLQRIMLQFVEIVNNWVIVLTNAMRLLILIIVINNCKPVSLQKINLELYKICQ